jgi:predicted small secreted protein
VTRRQAPPSTPLTSASGLLLPAAVLVVTTVLAACSPEQATGPDHTGREIFEALDPLPSCGEVEVGPDAPDDVVDDGWACLDDADDAGAQLTVTLVTPEGDPVVEHHRVGPGIDGLDTYVDATADRYGEQIWTYRSCPDTDTTAQPRGCWESALVEG